ncbi:hypothetical protein MPTK1_3g21450 [Marchantia polymorpha subsp. ruderalis]|uniref:Uncharacterized protein n=2 Tax=Marchantia polymorpha TaxID=3197 RepID=A0AAF6B386_MARPO|nr:hypothetical protein MARPO_0089s0071 [Marchantia polymorpha]BBN06470.1 hypothetical protein Mp_3g21450 [Marchantia polymorpha subsp. ruderalis]|eukprot:PTQ33449.1 hypothetical protein MARPO_0089s0071 [Marchantia polymorpha]
MSAIEWSDNSREVRSADLCRVESSEPQENLEVITFQQMQLKGIPDTNEREEHKIPQVMSMSCNSAFWLLLIFVCKSIEDEEASVYSEPYSHRTLNLQSLVNVERILFIELGRSNILDAQSDTNFRFNGKEQLVTSKGIRVEGGHRIFEKVSQFSRCTRVSSNQSRGFICRNIILAGLLQDYSLHSTSDFISALNSQTFCRLRSILRFRSVLAAATAED